ncbi:MAG: peptidase U32 family protein [Candidatus Walczuchella monophlebidarum]
MVKDGRIELMSPAGDWASLQAAIDHGADSVYFGVEQFNMRAVSTKNFTIEELAEVVNLCKEKGVRTYLAMNTIIYDHDLSVIKKVSNTAKKIGIDALIVMDQAIINYARQIGMEVHISTQLNITNIETVKFYSFFADVMVLSRELSLKQIQKISKQIQLEEIMGPSGRLVEIEIFCHGAQCMAISGKCYLSLHSKNSSANRGACKQNCRKKYTVIDQENGFDISINNEYMMSPKDLCTIDFLDKIISSGVKILKIEGRGRSPEYVAVTTACYREAIDAIANDNFEVKNPYKWRERINSVYNRGFWSGYYLGKKLVGWSEVSGSVAIQKKVYLGKGRHYYTKSSIGEFIIEAHAIHLGDKILIIGPTTGVKEIQVNSLKVENLYTKCAYKGQICTIPINFRIRNSDKIYKLVKNDVNHYLTKK